MNYKLEKFVKPCVSKKTRLPECQRPKKSLESLQGYRVKPSLCWPTIHHLYTSVKNRTQHNLPNQPSMVAINTAVDY